METFGATGAPLAVATSPRPAGAILAENPDTPAPSASRSARRSRSPPQDPETNYALGSVLNHVLLHQTVIGEEALLQFATVGETPDLIVGCTGGGSNFGGLAFPFLREKLAGRMSPTIRAVEPASCPSLTRGVYAYDFGDTAGMTPLMKMHTLGHDFVPDPIHAGGLRYHGMSPAALARLRARADRGDRDPADRVLRGRASGSPAPRASCPRRSRPTRWPRASGRRWPARRPARRRSSSPRCAGTATSTWPPTTPTSPARMVDEDVTDERFAEALTDLPQVPAGA